MIHNNIVFPNEVRREALYSPKEKIALATTLALSTLATFAAAGLVPAAAAFAIVSTGALILTFIRYQRGEQSFQIRLTQAKEQEERRTLLANFLQEERRNIHLGYIRENLRKIFVADTLQKAYRAKVQEEKNKMYEIMSQVASLLTQDPALVEQKMQESIELPVRSFKPIYESFYHLILQKAMRAGFSEEQARAFLDKSIENLLLIRLSQEGGNYIVKKALLTTITLSLLPETPQIIAYLQELVPHTTHAEFLLWNANMESGIRRYFFDKFYEEVCKITPQSKQRKSFFRKLSDRFSYITQESSLKLREHRLPALEREALYLRLFAHQVAYNDLEVGDEARGIGKIIYHYHGAGIHLAVAFDEREKTLHFFNGGTQDSHGAVRDCLHGEALRSWLTAFTREEQVKLFEALRPCIEKIENRSLKCKVHGHSLGGHDAQLWLLALTRYILQFDIFQEKVTHLMVNTQNALRIPREYAEEFATLLPQLLEQGVSVHLHHGRVAGDTVQEAGDRLVGAGCESYLTRREAATFTMSIADHTFPNMHNLSAHISAQNHTISANLTTARVITDPGLMKPILSGGRFGNNNTPFEPTMRVMQSLALLLPLGAFVIIKGFALLLEPRREASDGLRPNDPLEESVTAEEAPDGPGVLIASPLASPPNR